MKQVLLYVLVLIVSIPVKGQQIAPTISFNTEKHNFGTINKSNGSVTHRFTFINTGSKALQIERIKTSCGCTSTDWTKNTVNPGNKGFVKVSFDPNSYQGSFSQRAIVWSNASNSPVVLRITGKIKRSVLEKYPVKTGKLRIKTNYLHENKIFNTDTITDSIPVYNNGSNPVTLSFKDVPAHLKITALPQTLESKATGTIQMQYFTPQNKDWGYVYDRFILLQDGKRTSNNVITVSATIREDFSQLTPGERENAPVIDFRKDTHNFGTANQNSKLTHKFYFTNKGERTLHIRKIRTSCGCTTTVPNDKSVEPGETTYIKVVFDTGNFQGHQEKAITVISNDPENSISHLRLKANIQVNN